MKPIPPVLGDPLYFPRTQLAQALLNGLQAGISHAFTLFAPRRMGKTQFLLQDIMPQAQAMGFRVFYFSFMDMDPEHSARHFQAALAAFEANRVGAKVKRLLGSVKSLNVAGSGVAREPAAATETSVSQIIGKLAQGKQPVLLLLDEVQELARVRGTEGIVRSLRTGLDRHKDVVKVIFTGSSTNGLRAMFNDGKAPFFHFAHNIDFPELQRDFTDYLADVYVARTEQAIDRDQLYQIFERMNRTPLYLRLVVEDMILNPALGLAAAAERRIAQTGEQANYEQLWWQLNALDQYLLQCLARGQRNLYQASARQAAAQALGVEVVTASSVQGSIRKLERRELLTRDSHGRLCINEAAFQTWITEWDG